MNDARFKGDLHVPRVKPFSSDTWEVQGNLQGTIEISERVSLVYPAPCRIVGLYPSLTINGATPGGGSIPTLDDIMVYFDANQQRRFTNQIGQTTQAQRQQGYVTLNALNTVIRDLNIVIDNARPDTGFQFRWKRFVQGAPIYPDMIVSLALFVEIND